MLVSNKLFSRKNVGNFMKKLSAIAIALSIASFGLTGAGASPLEEVVLQPAAKASKFFPDCTSATQLNCIESFGVFEREGEPSSVVLGKEVSYNKKNFLVCNPLDSNDCLAYGARVPAYQVQSADGLLTYFVGVERFSKKQNAKRISSSAASLDTEVNGFNVFMRNFQPKSIQLKVRTSSLRPIDASYYTAGLDWEVENLAKGRLWTISFVPPEDALASLDETFSGPDYFGMFTLNESEKSMLKFSKCFRKGLFTTGSNFQKNPGTDAVRGYGDFLKWRAKEKALTFPIEPPFGDGPFVPDNFQIVMDDAHIACASKKKLKAGEDFLVEASTSAGPLDSIIKSVQYKDGILTIKLTGVPREKVDIRITQPSS